MAWNPLATRPTTLSDSGGGSAAGGPTRSPLPYSPSGFNYNGGGYSQRDLDGGLGDRPFKDVGKLNLNLLDPLERARAGEALGAGANWGLDNAPKTGLSFIDDYYEQPGGFFAGIFGALGGTLGKTGSDIGATLGKTLEAPLGLVGGLGIPGPFVSDINKNLEGATPDLLEDIVRVPSNLGAMFESGLNLFGLMGRAVERTYAGFSGERGTLPEDIQAKIDSGELSRDEALDELVMSGRGFTNDPIHNLLFSMVLDPVNLLSLGTGAAIKALEGTNKVARAISATGDLTRVANFGDAKWVSELAEVASRADMGRITPGGLQTRSQLNAVRRALSEGDNPILQLSRGERMGLAAFGPVSAENSAGFIRVVDKVQRMTDPLAFFGMGSIAKRSSHHLVTAGTSGVIAAYKPIVVHGLARTLENINPAYRDKLENALATYATNLINRYVIDEVGSDALKQGAVPRVADGAQNVNPSELAKGLTEGGAYDVNVGRHIEIMAERNKPRELLTGTREAITNQTLAKLAEMTGGAIDEMAAAIPKVDDDLALLVHAAYFADRGTALQRIAQRIQSAPNRVTAKMPADLVKNANRLAMVAERTLTKQRAAPLEAAIAGKDMALIRALASKYSDFDWMAPAQMTDENLLRSLQGWLLDNKPGLPEEVQLIDPVTGLLRTDLPADLAEWAKNADTFGYGLALAPPKDLPTDVLWRMTKDQNGKTIALNPWLDFVADLPEGTQVQIPNRLAATRMQLTRSIRQERILWAAKRKFSVALAVPKDDGARVPVDVAARIFDRLIVDASVQGVQVRGLRPDLMMESAKKVLQQERERLGIGVQDLTERQVLKAVLEAFNGDLAVVGLTQRITGTAKQRLPGAGMNMWGQISEKLYPLMRFSLNPVFLAMETTEPYILNWMRGIKTPMLRDRKGFREALQAHVTMENMLRNATAPEGFIAEQAEYIRTLAYTNQMARAEFGSSSKLGLLASRWRPDIARRKEAAQALQTKVLFGERMEATFRRIKGDQFEDFWTGLAEHYGTVDTTEIAWRWANENLAIQDVSGEVVHTMLQLQSPQALGRQLRLTRYKTGGSLGFDDLEAAIDRHYAYDGATNRPSFASRAAGRKQGDVLYDDLRSGVMSKDDLVREMKTIGVESDDHVNTIWHMATGVEVEDFWKSWRDTFTQGVTGTAGRWTRIARRQETAMARSFVQARAAAMGWTEEEFIRRRVAADARLLPAGTPVTAGALMEQRRAWVGQAAMRAASSTDSTRDDVLRAVADDSGEFFYQSLHGDDIDDLASGERYSADAYDWAEAGDLDTVTANLMNTVETERWANGNATRGLIRIRKDSPAGVNMVKLDADWRHPQGNVHRDDIEYYDFTLKRWRKAGETGFERKLPPMPDAADLRLTKGGTSYTALSAAPPGLSLKDMDVLMRPDVRRARGDYKSHKYGVINTAARRVPFVDRETGEVTQAPWEIPWVIETLPLLDEFTQLGMLNKSTQMWRGINIARVEDIMGQKMTVDYRNLKPGSVFDEDAFMSWADDEDIADRFVKNLGGFDESVTGVTGTDAVKLYAEFPAGTRLGIIGGFEAEQLVPRNSSWEVTSVRVEKHYDDFTGDTHIVRHIGVRPVGGEPLPGVQRVGIEEATAAEVIPVKLRQDAILDPDELRARAGDGDELALRRANEHIRRAQETAPPAGGVDLQDLTDGLTSEELVSVARSATDFRDRLSQMFNELGPHRLSVAMGWAFEQGETNSYRALQGVLHEMERTWAGEAGDSDMLRTFLKGEVGSRATVLGPRGSDVQDVLLGNTSRRADGRGNVLQPVIVDDLAARAAGYPLGTGGLMEHEHTVIYFNNLKDAANRDGLGGRTDWTADEVRALASYRLETKLGVPDSELLSGETYAASEYAIPVELHGALKTKRGRPIYDGLMDIIAEPQNEDARVRLVSFVNQQIETVIRDELGLGFKSHGDLSIGRWGDNRTQPLVGVVSATTPAMARNLADIMGYWLDQEEVWAFTKVPTSTDPAALEGLSARLSVLIPLDDDISRAHGIRQGVAHAERLADRLGIEGATIRELDNGDVSLTIITQDARKAGTYDEMADALDEAFPHDDVPEWDLEYGELYAARPPRKANGQPDWNAYGAEVESRLASRGLAGWDGARLDGSRTKIREDIRGQLKRQAPKQADRAFRGEDLVPHILEDRRRGNVLGQTAIDENRAIISGFGAADPITGLHELMHVFAIDLDDSMRQVVQRARLQMLDTSRTDLAARISAYETRAQNAKSQRSRASLQSRANALKQDLGELVDETEWGVEHEEFLVSQFQRWLKTGTNDNPALVPAFQHFRNWVELLWKELGGGRGGVADGVSPEMDRFFNRMFQPKGVQTVNYDLDTQVLRMAGLQQLGGAWDEAFATHYYKKDRSMLERSMNHPYIGLYPASYMWGKVLPELIRFLALRPFGMPTPFLAWNVLREVSDTVRTQMETDEGWKQFAKDNEEAWMMASMFFPGLPQDIPANVPLPWRRVAEQGLEQQLSYQMGEDPTPINYTKGLEDAMFYAVGPAGTIRSVSQAAGMAGDLARTTLGGVTEAVEGAQTEPVYIPGR